MSLEVDRRNELPIPLESQKEPFRYQSEPEKRDQNYPYSTGDHRPVTSLSAQQQHNEKATILFLSIAFAVMTVLAVVAAGIGGSIAAKRGHNNQHLNELVHNTTDQLHNCTAYAGTQQGPLLNSTSPSNSSTNGTFTPTQAIFVPTSNCSAMSDTYTTAQTGSIFNIHCHTDYPGSDILGVYVFRFADCMEACASWNLHRDQNSPQCFAIAYDHGPNAYPEYSGMGNCWFKNSDNVTASGSKGADGAVLQFDS